MSDPMTNMEIEDVLSSIRRLVSQDLRPGFRTESPHDPKAADLPEGKLVLTPAFRVADAPVAASEEPVVWRRAASRYRVESGETDGQPAEPDAEAAAGQDQDAEWHEVAQADSGSEFPDDAADLQHGEDDLAETALTEPEPTVEAERVAGSDDHALRGFESDGDLTDAATLEAAIADLEAAVAARNDEWEPDGSEMGVAEHFVLPAMGVGRALPEAAEAFGIGQQTAEPGMRRLHLEPGAYLDDAAEPVWADNRAEQPPARPATNATIAGDSRSMFAGDDTLLDEGMLRELVIEVIRQELQGALGERITRNVRKLVRAEIHRALAGREFE